MSALLDAIDAEIIAVHALADPPASGAVVNAVNTALLALNNIRALAEAAGCDCAVLQAKIDFAKAKIDVAKAALA